MSSQEEVNMENENVNMEKKIDIDNNSNIIHIGHLVANTSGSKNKWKVCYTCDKKFQKQENGRIYLLVVNDEIYKIGSSSCIGGIKTTFSFYEGGLGGSPSIRTFGIHMLLQNELDKGSNIKIYSLFNEAIEVVVKGLTSEEKKITYPDIKVMEELCRKNYKEVYGKYPLWNFQENGEKWPDWINEAYKEQVNNRGKGTKQKKEQAIDTIQAN